MSEWVSKELQNCNIEIIDGDRGVNYPSREEFTSEGHCLFLNTSNIVDDKFHFGACDFITEQKDALLRKGKLRRNDIVLTTRGTVGSVAFYHKGVTTEHIRINSGMVILRGDESFDPVFLYNLFKSSLLKQQYILFASGSAQPQLPIKDLKRTVISFPSLPVQRKIAAILSAYDDLIENNTRRIALLERMAEEVYSEWFVRLRFPGHEENQLEYKPLREFVDSYIGGGWGSDEVTGSDNCPIHVIRGTDFDEIVRGNISNVPIRYISSSNLKVQVGDIIMENSVNHQSRTAGKCILATKELLSMFDGDVICASFCKLIRPQNILLSRYLQLNFSLLFSQGLFEYYQNVATNGIANLQIERLLNRHQVPVPPVAAIDFFNSSHSNGVALILQNLRCSRDMLLGRLLSGKVDVEPLDIRGDK